MSALSKTSRSPAALAALTLAALGIVYGDIGTSPLYGLKEIFHGGHVAATPANILGVLSLVFWALTVVISLKYVLLILRAGNNGEGVPIAMLALATHAVREKPRLRRYLMTVGLFGTAVFYGDGVITPAISVLSPIEGLEVAAPGLHDWVIPLTLIVLTALFAVQRFGTSGIGKWFGPITLVWFAVLVALGFIAAQRCWLSSGSVRWCWWSPAARRCTPTSGTSASCRSASRVRHRVAGAGDTSGRARCFSRSRRRWPAW